MTPQERWGRAVAAFHASKERLWAALSLPDGPERRKAIWDEMTMDHGRWWEEPEESAPSDKGGAK